MIVSEIEAPPQNVKSPISRSLAPREQRMRDLISHLELCVIDCEATISGDNLLYYFDRRFTACYTLHI
jgi:hypothetical protein